MDNTTEIAIKVILVLIVIGVLWYALREIVCWYYKINERIDLQKETNRLLRKMVGEPELLEEKKSEPIKKEIDPKAHWSEK